MSVVITTSLGDITVDLYTDKCPLTSKNFLKLCKIKYYNGCLFHKVEKDFTAQTGDPTGKGTGGDSIYKFLYGDQARFFNDEIHPDLKHSDFGTVAMASAGKNLNASQFYITLREDLDYLDGEHTVFGKVEEGHDVLKRINEAYVDDQGRPYKNIRIKHTYIIDDPFDDPPQLSIPDRSPEGKPAEEVADIRLEDDWVPLDEQLRPEELEELIREREAHSRAVVLEGVGDIPDAEIKPPENVLFVCKLNPVTQDEDLDTIFSRFGNVISAEIIRDSKTGDSLCYAFIEFESQESCENAYFKMNNALIDDRRIHVDFSQSVAKLWSAYRRGGKNQGAQGKGCFTCGSEDHVAKNCPESKNAKAPPLKYTLKDENTQRGDNAQQRYDMVFDGDHVEASKSRGRRHREHITEDEHRRSKDHRSLGRQHREHDRRDSRSDRGWHDDSHKKYGDVRNHDGNQGSRNHDALRRDTTEDSQRGSEHEGRHDRRDERAGYYDRMNSRDADRDLQNVDKIRRHYSGLHQSREGEDRKNDRGYTTETREGYHDKRNSRVTDRDVQNDVKVRNHHSGLHESREKEDPKRDRGYTNETKSDRRHRDERR